ncbi:hypothetical protein ACVV62_07720 [Streptococcus pluranimalium]
MLAILKPIFESIWKRKETKIFIGLAILTPTFILISTFLPEEANFYQPGVIGDYRIPFVGMAGMIHGTANSVVLPILALFYLTYTVFRGESDSRTLFLYKDIKRSDIFWAKVVSLIGIIFIYSGAIVLITLVYFYARLGHMDYSTLTFWDYMDSAGNPAFFQTFFGESFSMMVCVFLAAFLSLKKGLGLTMATSFIYLIVMTVINNFGFGFLSPLGNRDALFEGGNFSVIFGLSALVTLIYSSALAHVSLKHCNKMEF